MTAVVQEYIPKEEIEVRVELWDRGGGFTGTMFVGSAERIYDVLNNANPFIALRVDGQLQFINKHSIDGIIPVDDERMQRRTHWREMFGRHILNESSA